MNNTTSINPAAEQTAADSPRNPAEEGVAEIWANLLGGERFGMNDTLLSIGGESLLAAQVVARIHDRFGVDIQIRTVLVSTIAQIAAEVEAKMQSR